MARVRIVPFKCEECGKEFAETQGGICSACNRLLCRKHLVIPLRERIRLRDTPTPLCTSCQQAGDQPKTDTT
ncbi:MAG: hypothetical protein ACREIE_08255 [Nitrospiraceae bacterium]